MKQEEKSLQDQLKLESRICGECGYIVLNPFYERCPRCYTVLAKLELYCNGCIHNSVCPAKTMAEEERHSS